MILTDLNQADMYQSVHPRIPQGIAYLRSDAWQDKPPGRYEIDGDNIYAMIQEYQTIPVEEGRWEAHQVYADIQYVVTGIECIGCGELQDFTPETEYDRGKDIGFYQGSGTLIPLREGMLAILFPHDVHMPKIMVSEAVAVRKIVIKVRL